jgi:hypothetical protein
LGPVQGTSPNPKPEPQFRFFLVRFKFRKGLDAEPDVKEDEEYPDYVIKKIVHIFWVVYRQILSLLG